MPADSPVFERTLGNGLKVLLREAREAPLASLWVWYRVGSRNELPGLTGVSHWVEHMQFKGTPTLAKGAIFGEVSKNGGTLNALTSNDWTGYFETLPSDRIDLSLRIESDRMVNSLFDPEETESERTVILSERQGAENSPSFLLYEEVVGVAFRAHPYRHLVIGHESDLRSITRDDLYDHYRQSYHPANAFISAAGDFDAEELFDRIDRAFGGIEPGSALPPIRAQEPSQIGERRVTLRRPAPTSYLRIAYHAPAARHPDTAALLVADAILSGGKAMGLGGGGPMGRSSRLYRALVAGGLARAAGSDFDLTVDPYLMMVAVTGLPGVDPDRIERVVLDEIGTLASEPVPDAELGRALKQVKAQYVYSAEGVTNQAFWLGQMEIVDSFRRAETLIAEIEAVTADDVRRVASTYLAADNRTVGWLLPDGPGGGDAELDVVAACLPYRYWSIGGAPLPKAAAGGRPPFERAELPNGIVVLGQAQPGDPAVAARIRIDAGSARDPASRPGLAAFTARTLTRGTSEWSFESFNETTDSLGASFGVEVGRRHAEIHIQCLREDFTRLLDLAARVLRDPTFPEDEVEKVRNEILAGIHEQDNDTGATSDRVLRELLYPDDHPLRHRVSGELSSVSIISRDDLTAFHRDHYGPRVCTIAVVGGVDDFQSAVDDIAARFSDWSGAAAPRALASVAEPPTATVRATVEIAGKSQADVALGFVTLPRSDPHFYAFEMANQILGRLGLMGRLGTSVRDEQGLAYYAFSSVEPGREGSVWLSRAGVSPENVEQAVESIVAEVRRLTEEAVSAEELADAKAFMTGIVPLALETNDGIAATLLNIEHYQLGLDYVDRYPSIINALSRDDLLAAVRTHLDANRLAIAVAAPAADDSAM